mmetsp:Transcript_24591/g.62249  ORF Transcript_24591/g.62249 Transcript_24591/m.62249 type:complete len:81 (+) Transcript_24591:1138-1380(+)
MMWKEADFQTHFLSLPDSSAPAFGHLGYDHVHLTLSFSSPLPQHPSALETTLTPAPNAPFLQSVDRSDASDVNSQQFYIL